jgi:methylmalonyl-CoA mutase
MDFSTFDKVTKDQWLEKITVDLKGKSIDTLDWVINESLVVSPFKDESDLKYVGLLDTVKEDNRWFAMEPIVITDDLAQANGEILAALQGGTNGIRLHAHRALSLEDLDILFSDVYLDMIALDWVIGTVIEISDQMSMFAGYVQAQGKSMADLNLSIDADIVNINQTFVAKYPAVRSITIDGLAYYQGIAGVHAELGKIIYELHEAIEHIGQDDLESLYKGIQIKLAIDDCYLLNIAAVRAIRHLVRLLFEGYGYTLDQDVFISGIIPDAILVDDINYNRIKQSAAALSAVAASADTIQIYRDHAGSESPAFSRKIARNIFHLMSMESYMDRVVDPAAGSYYIESLTDSVSQMAWAHFKELWTKKKQA